MKALWVMLIVLIFAGVLFSQQPALTGEQILEKNVEATGGRAAWEQVKSYFLEANFTGAAPSIIPLSVATPIPIGNGGTLQVAYQVPDKYRSLMSVTGIGDFFYACNGSVRKCLSLLGCGGLSGNGLIRAMLGGRSKADDCC